MELALFNDLLTFTVNSLTDVPVAFVSPSSKPGRKQTQDSLLNSQSSKPVSV